MVLHVTGRPCGPRGTDMQDCDWQRQWARPLLRHPGAPPTRPRHIARCRSCGPSWRGLGPSGAATATRTRQRHQESWRRPPSRSGVGQSTASPGGPRTREPRSPGGGTRVPSVGTRYQASPPQGDPTGQVVLRDDKGVAIVLVPREPPGLFGFLVHELVPVEVDVRTYQIDRQLGEQLVCSEPPQCTSDSATRCALNVMAPASLIPERPPASAKRCSASRSASSVAARTCSMRSTGMQARSSRHPSRLKSSISRSLRREPCGLASGHSKPTVPGMKTGLWRPSASP